MARVTGAVVVGYLVIVSFPPAYFLLGADVAFQPGSYDVSGLWIVLSFGLGFAAAFLGGWVCATIARDPRGPMVLAGLVFVLGVAVALPALVVSPGNPGPRAPDVGNLAAMQQAVTPVWITLVNPVMGAISVLLAGRLYQARPRRIARESEGAR